MRASRRFALPVLACLLLAGCTAPEEEGTDELEPCPQWVEGPGRATETVELAEGGNATLVLDAAADANRTWNGYPLDRFLLEVRVLSGGPVEMRAHAADGRQVSLYEGFGGSAKSVAFAAIPVEGDGTIDILLGAITEGGPRAEAPVNATFLSRGPPARLEVETHPMFRVCGVL